MPKGIFIHKPHTEETKKKIGDSKKGTRVSIKTEFKKGITPWNKGKTGIYSKQTLQKMGFVSKGRKLTEEHKKKIGLGNKGKKGFGLKGEMSPRWKGGISHINKLERTKFRQTIQKQVFERDDYTCQLCGQRNGDLQVDHIQSWSEYIELRFSMDNCRTLCMNCHYRITFHREKPKDLIWGHNFKHIMQRGGALKFQ